MSKKADKDFRAKHPRYFKRHWKQYYAKNKEAIKKRRRERYLENKEQEKRKTRAYYKKNRSQILRKQSNNRNRKGYFKEARKALKKRVVAAYGGKCACCGETHWELLTIDHPNGGGRKDRASKVGGLYAWLERNGYPQEGYRCLCMSCNFSFGMYGYCPHQTNDSAFPTELYLQH